MTAPQPPVRGRLAARDARTGLGLDDGSPFHAVLLARLGEGAKPGEEVDEQGWPAVRARVEAALQAVGEGRVVVVADDTDREDEGDLIVAAEHTTAETVSFLLRHTSGLLCVALAGERCDALELPLMVPLGAQAPGDAMGTAFTISVDVLDGTTTGISAGDRAATVRALVDPATRPRDLRRPGHVFPLRAREGGVLRRPGHTEAAVDLARLAGCAPGGLICEVVDPDRSGMARRPQLQRLASRYDLPYLTVADLVLYRRRTERVLQRVADARLPTAYGDFRCLGYRSALDGEEHVALVRGDVSGGGEPVLVRLHSECLTGDAFGSLRCDCGEQLDASLRRVAEAERGVVVYLRGHEGRGIGLTQKLLAYALQDAGRDTVDANLDLGHPADARDYLAGVDVLTDLGVHDVRLLTNNPEKERALRAAGLQVECEPLPTTPTPDNASYLETKRTRMGHRLAPV